MRACVKQVAERGEGGGGGKGLIAGADVFVSSMAAWLMMNDCLSVKRLVVTSLSMRRRVTVL